MNGISRRKLLAASGLGIAAGAVGLPTLPAGATMLGGVQPGALPSADQLRREVKAMVQLGPRLPGTAAHDTFVNRLADGFRGAGLQVTRDSHHFTRWLADDFGLDVLDGTHAGPVPVATYYTYSGRTPVDGLVAGLTYLGPLPTPPLSGALLDLAAAQHALSNWSGQLRDAAQALVASAPNGIRGQVVLVEAPILPLPLGIVYPLLTYAHDPERTLSPADDFKRAWTTLLSLPVLEPFKAAGAAGVVFVLDASPDNAKGQYTPFIHGYQDLPALIVDRDAGVRLRAAAAEKTRVRLILDASLQPNTPSDSLVAVLPGLRRPHEVLIVHTHTDGQNAFEENAGIALVALARHFARGGRSVLDRTLVFSAVSGHFAAELPETAGFVEGHPDLIDRAVAQVTLEHLGSTEWLDDAEGYHPSGLVEPAIIFHSLTPIALTGIRSLKEADLRRALMLKPLGPFFFGVGAGLHAAGVPSLAHISSPNYLLALDGKSGHLDKFDASRARREVAWAADALRSLDRVPAAILKAGDAGVYGALPLPAFPPEL